MLSGRVKSKFVNNIRSLDRKNKKREKKLEKKNNYGCFTVHDNKYAMNIVVKIVTATIIVAFTATMFKLLKIES